MLIISVKFYVIIILDFIANIYAIKTIHTLHMDMFFYKNNCNKHKFARHKCFHNIAKNIS